jgi:hypothetical protein
MAKDSSSGKVTRMMSTDVITRRVPDWLLEIAKSKSKKISK